MTSEQELEASRVVMLAKIGNRPALQQRLFEDGSIPRAVINRALLRSLSHDNSIDEHLVGMVAQRLVERTGADGLDIEPAIFRAVAKDVIRSGVVRLLIETGGADVNIVETFVEDRIGFTPLLYACLRGLVKTAEFLCRCEGIDLSPRDQCNHFTPMTWAIRSGNQTIARMLLEAGADANGMFNDDPSKGNYLPQAVAYGNIDIVSALLDHGAAASDRSCCWGKVPAIQLAGSREMVNLLIGHGASVHDQDCHGNTPLFTVKSPSTTLALLEAGANVRHVNKLGQNALVHACGNKQDDKVQVILEHGACLLGSEALTVAAENKRFNVVRLLLTRTGIGR